MAYFHQRIPVRRVSLIVTLYYAELFPLVQRWRRRLSLMVTVPILGTDLHPNFTIFLPPANEVWGKVIFLHQFVILFTRGGMRGCSGGHMRGCSGGASKGGMCGCLGGGMHGCLGGCAWFYFGGCMVLFRGACMVLFKGVGHAWFYSGGGMHGFFSFFGYNEIRSMSRRYASYWNAFL